MTADCHSKSFVTRCGSISASLISSTIHEGIEYNVSRPFERGTLEEWDGLVPVGCNVGVTLTAFTDCPPRQDPDWSSTEFVDSVGQTLADLLRRRVYHHRTWLRAGKNVTHKRVFQPKSRRG